MEPSDPDDGRADRQSGAVDDASNADALRAVHPELFHRALLNQTNEVTTGASRIDRPHHEIDCLSAVVVIVTCLSVTHKRTRRVSLVR